MTPVRGYRAGVNSAQRKDYIMFGLGAQELLIIFAIVTVLFGAQKLPQLGSSLAKGITNFKGGLKESDTKEDKLDSPEA